MSGKFVPASQLCRFQWDWSGVVGKSEKIKLPRSFRSWARIPADGARDRDNFKTPFNFIDLNLLAQLLALWGRTETQDSVMKKTFARKAASSFFIWRIFGLPTHSLAGTSPLNLLRSFECRVLPSFRTFISTLLIYEEGLGDSPR